MKIRIREDYHHMWIVEWDTNKLIFSSKEDAYDFIIQLTK